MTLRTFLPGIPQRYAFAGSAVGAILPLFCFTVESTLQGVSINPWTILSDPTHLFMALMPVFCGIVFYRIGWTRQALEQELSQAAEAERRLFFEARHDRLTGLSNRLSLEVELRQLMKSREQGVSRPAVLLLDLDKFKHVNDTLGHDVGDALLIGIAQRLDGLIGPFCRLFRLGGDEFIITIAGVPGEAEISRLGETIVREMGQPMDLKGNRVQTAVSIGVTFMQPDDRQMGQILKRADLALYRAKELGGSCHVFYTEALGEAALLRLSLERDLASAVQRDQLELVYQPIIDLDGDHVQGFEALVRWRRPDWGLIGPDSFLREAEASGLIIPIGTWVLKTACRQAAAWPVTAGLAVNIAPAQFRDIGFVDLVLETLAETGLAPDRLTLDVTERTFALDPTQVRQTFAALRKAGVRIALDDFGAGMSTISQLRLAPVDSIKIDRSLADAMLDNHRDAELVDTIVRLARIFNTPATVEGIETEGQLQYVRTIGAAHVQGYLFSAPVAADQVMDVLVKSKARDSLRASA